ncbi:T9SS type A sorting domain-containing protein [Brumimicrobium oceani]|uniref:Secretion system C-terminal sorting domain-containing protein n=1 Tax=Brumimicrobium oceani TaxID=2100725 RepID=A0A2U2XE94_9FLAO|nr:T9SS type A sorting domain-containing protein [Brumimicrobium oceani]PWH86128.1 hypothetical protein DIT68_06120 [Brumimicrobium oceani]
MKKNLLLVASLFIGATSIAQFTQTNAPADGDGTTLFVIDSLAPSFAAVTGSGVTWDYSSYAGYGNETRNITALDATTTTNAASFPNSTISIDLENFLQTYSSSSSTDLTGRGFVYNEPNVGEIIAQFNSDQANMMSFPMDENSAAINDVFSGDLNYTLPFAGTQTTPLTGILKAEVDGKGTLVLANNSFSNVLRYSIRDTINSTVTGLGDIQMVRSQYEYYDHAQSTLPIFIHISVDFGILGGAALSSSTLVMSLEDPTGIVGLSKNELASTSVYPVPATEELNIELPASVETANLTMTDVQGRQVYSTVLNASKKTIDVSNMKKGMYILNISSDATSVTKNIVIK